ncbi:AMP-binding protein [Haloferula sp. BvORR071]|uniref:AMP-binding protein n=1 Tax=Haloferula sp. BvORR071 TaxID=1396141 RepID=UPI002240FB43|nr:AMP-binding protein [Haloferula sp. BvORR071]
MALLRERAALHPGRPALIDRHKGCDRSVGFAELLQRVERGAGRLKELGLKRGSTILVFQPVSIELYEILLAAFHGGLRVMLADPSAGRAFLSLCCQRLPPDAFFGPWKAHLLKLAVPGLRRIPRAICSTGWFPAASAWSPGHPASMEEVPDEEPALITFTSGSTGVPKAAVRSHGFLMAQHRALEKALDFSEAEVDLITLPVFVLANLASGLTSVLADTDLRSPGKADAAAIRAQCERHGVTRCAASPAFFEALLAGPDSLPQVSKVYTGGAPVFPDLLERLQAALPDAEVTAVFGSTEAEPMSHLGAHEYSADLVAQTAAGFGLCAGVPVPEVELRIIRDHWGQSLAKLTPEELDNITVAPGEPGEVIVTGDHVLSGYLGGVGDKETKIHVAGKVWHRTGDAAWLDESGRLWLLGRCAAKLPASSLARAGLPEGALDYPFAIESALRARHPGTRTAALGLKGRRVLVTTVADMEAEAAEFGIDEVIRVEAIPLDRRHNAKIDYPALLKLLGEA